MKGEEKVNGIKNSLCAGLRGEEGGAGAALAGQMPTSFLLSLYPQIKSNSHWKGEAEPVFALP